MSKKAEVPQFKLAGGEVSIDVLGVHRHDGTKHWYRLPSWRVEFVDERMHGIDWRVHKGIGFEDGWVLAEATTGYKAYDGYGDHEMDEVVALFIELELPKLDRAKVLARIAKAREAIKDVPRLTPGPFEASASSAKEGAGDGL